jgi:two-component system, OmpR family, phosphate regulon sensor histidine kinase PhoR
VKKPVGVNPRTRKTILITFITIFLPLVTYLVYEISSLDENEEMVESIYKDQLESVLYTVNQYATDFLSAQLDIVENKLSTGNSPTDLTVGGIDHFQIVRSVDAYELADKSQLFSGYFQQTLDENEETIKQLVGYLENDYRKLQPLNMIELDGNMYQIMLVAIKNGASPDLFIGAIDPFSFTLDILQPKMQEIGNEEMIISLKNKDTGELIYSTDSNQNTMLANSDMWLFPDLILEISPKNLTIANVVQRRLTNNLIALGILIALLILGFILIFRNINKEMHLAQAKSDFVSNVSHELRTPLSLISMFTESLVYGRVPKIKETQYLEIILKETNRLTNIVNRILNFSRIEANKRTYHKAEFEINDLVKEVLTDYSYHLEQHGFDYDLDLSPTSILMNVDRDAIYEAIVNLIDNAVKYSEENKKLIIKTGDNSSHAYISVKDHGVGIPPEKQQQIFDKFFRVSKGDVYMAQGTGLGLTIISHIMHAHNGTIDVESEEGKGSTFTLRFNK